MLLDFSLTKGIAISGFEVTNDKNTSGLKSHADGEAEVPKPKPD